MFAESYDAFVANRATSTDGSSLHRRTAKAGALAALKRISQALP